MRTMYANAVHVIKNVQFSSVTGKVIRYVSSELTRRLSALVGPLQVSEVGYSREQEQEVGVCRIAIRRWARTPVGLFFLNNRKLRLLHVRWVRAQRAVFSSTHEGVPKSILCIIAVGFWSCLIRSNTNRALGHFPPELQFVM